MRQVELRRSALCLLAYLALSIVFTWPLARGLATDVPGDLGDSLLNMWILGWNAEQIPRLLTGSSDWQGYWNANIFHPEPYALALSEHMFVQGLTIAPVYALTGNIILGYNLLFLATFVLSAFGTYLLVRDLTGDWRAGFVAGLVYGFLPYRISQIPHLQILSSQWMPFALWGLHRYVGSGSLLALAGATAALVAQNLSCGYFLLYFAPFVPLFVVQQLAASGHLLDRRRWVGLAGAGVVTLLVTLPFLYPYIEIQRLFAFERPIGEVVHFSANVWSYATAAEPIHLWGRALRYHPHGEGETFLGLAAALLAIIAVVQSLVDARRQAGPSPVAGWRRIVTPLFVILLMTQIAAFLSTIVAGGFNVQFAGLTIRASTPVRLLLQCVIALGLLLVVSRHARDVFARWVRSPVTFFLALLVLSAWLSLGPFPSTGPERVSGLGLYSFFYEYVPGFRGVRVPARYAMIAGLFLAVLAGYGAAALLRRAWGVWVAGLASILIVADSAAMPLETNRTWGQNEATPPARVYPAALAPPVYGRIATLPASSVIAEFPFGDAAWEIRYVYYAAAHGRRILNGYSGLAPPGYRRRLAALLRRSADEEAAWKALVDAGTTHVVVHGSAFADPDEPGAVVAWLEARGARLVERFDDGDALFELGGKR